MTKERSASVMDAIFASPEEDGKGRILRIMQEFLVSESEKNSAKLKGEGLHHGLFALHI
jgi:cohesin loading factor subunit SCC2